ncbi:MAG: isoprenylcysteine carboxylmethyltransferase family protein [Hyphomicrobium sp.]|nr:isoprenylcysteine carboxylmethyltransferase family protein [Hyphomicrobium sp.]
MGPVLILLYGIVAYLIAMASIAYAIGFVGNYWVPKSIDGGSVRPLCEALVVNILLLGLFAIQHSGMARRGFKKASTAIVSEPIERSTYVLLSALILWLLYWQWRPITDEIWRVDTPIGSTLLQAVYFIGWGIVLLSTFLISHTDLFCLKQVSDHWLGKDAAEPEFKTPALYKIVRHPIYLGFILAFWATPVMTLGHLLFAVGTTGYILIGIFLEERDLVTSFGESYETYRKRISMLIPWPPRHP